MILELELIPAYVSPPGEFLKMELEARGWTQKDLAEIINKPQQAISEMVKGKKRITAETSIRLASAFGTSADLWHGLEADYQLHSPPLPLSKRTHSPSHPLSHSPALPLSKRTHSLNEPTLPLSRSLNEPTL